MLYILEEEARQLFINEKNEGYDMEDNVTMVLRRKNIMNKEKKVLKYLNDNIKPKASELFGEGLNNYQLMIDTNNSLLKDLNIFGIKEVADKWFKTDFPLKEYFSSIVSIFCIDNISVNFNVKKDFKSYL